MNIWCKFAPIGPLLLGFFLLLGSVSAASQKPVRALFASDAVLVMQLEADFPALVRSSKTRIKPFDAMLRLEEEELSVTVEARGNSRRTRYCDFPPIRLRFQKGKGNKPPKGSIFRGQKSLKLVTHCSRKNSYIGPLMREYAAYKLYERFSDAHLKTRLVRVEYRRQGKIYTSRYGFFLEDADDAARRLGLKEIDIAKIKRSDLDSEAAARVALFQYMIGNIDYSLAKAAPGKDCCHNTKLLGLTKTSRTNLTPIPYDFDSSGLVDAPYATVPDHVKIRNVRERLYRGYCRNNIEAANLIDEVRAGRRIFTGVIDQINEMDKSAKNKAKRYLSSFFGLIGDDKAAERNILKKCR